MNTFPVGKETEVIAYDKDYIRIVRTTTGYAYAKNGNVHNPTPKYKYVVIIGGQRHGVETQLNLAKDWAKEIIADRLANAFEAGKAACQAGMERAPDGCKALALMLMPEVGSNVETISAWLRGWDSANLKHDE